MPLSRTLSQEKMTITGPLTTSSQAQRGVEGVDEKDANSTDEAFNTAILSIPNDLEEAENAPGVFPEGGWQAWKTVAGGFLIQFTCFGYLGAFGVYQTFYVREYLRTFSTSDIGWIGGIQLGLNFGLGAITGELFDRGYFYHLTTATVIIYALAIFMLSISHEGSFYQVFLTNGVALGLASGLTYSPSFAIAGHYFKARRPLAVGIISSGSSIGSLIHPIMLNNLINSSLGFHNAVRISGAMNVSLLLVALGLMRTRLPPKHKSEGLPIKKWLREPSYVILSVSCIPWVLGMFFVPFYIQLFAVTHGINEKLAFYTVPIYNAGSTLGRIIPPLAAHTFGILNMLVFSTIAAGVVVVSMLPVKNFLGVAFTGCFCGIFSGASVALTPALLAQMADHPSEIGARIGIYFGLCGFIGTFTTPILGALLTSKFRWTRTILFCGVSLVVTGVMYLYISHFLRKMRRSRVL